MLDFPDNNAFIKQIEKATAHNPITFKFSYVCWETGTLSRQAWQARVGALLCIFQAQTNVEQDTWEAVSLQILPEVDA